MPETGGQAPDPTPAAGGWIQPPIDLDLPGDLPASPSDGTPGYGQSEVLRYTGVSYRQLDHWARKKIVVPSVRNAAGSGSRRLYSLRDILAIRVLKRLTDAGVSLHNVSRAVQTLRRLGEADLASTVLVSDGVTVYQCRSDHEVIDLLRGGQGVFAIAISSALTDLRSVLAAPAPTGDLAARRARRRTTRSEATTDADTRARPDVAGD